MKLAATLHQHTLSYIYSVLFSDDMEWNVWKHDLHGFEWGWTFKIQDSEMFLEERQAADLHYL